jgi:Arc/MetJ-type ribon-helix-helix transcriptional regulator
MEQIEFLRKFPNASDFVRKLLDGLIASWEGIEDKFPALKAKIEVEELEKEIVKLEEEKTKHFYSIADEKEVYESYPSKKRLQTPEAKFFWQIHDEYGEKIEALRAKVEEIKRKHSGS